MIRTFTVHGIPVGKGRPKFRTVGAYVQAYTPEKTVNYETLVKLAYRQEFAGKPMLDGQIKAKIDAYFPIPKSTSKHSRALMQLGVIRHTKKPDADNVIKCICDALNGIAYQDDSAICSIEFHKKYDDVPRAEITLEDCPL